jgi:YD repeat-containing protein
LSLALLLLFSATNAHAQVRYVYDESGRLVQVIGLDGKSTRYRYDTAGNIISMVQDLTGALTISEFTPNRGPIGTTVTISGSGFSTTVSANIVKFNGVTATVSSATATKLVTRVPTGATTGPISVTVGARTATSAVPFTITSATDNGIPVITSFTPRIGFPGMPVSITGNNFSTTPTNNLVFFNRLQATVGATTLTTINTSVPAAATSGPIMVRTAAGTATSATDFFVVPTGYTAGNISAGQVLLPAEKKPRGANLTAGEKRHNRALSRVRVRVEHAIAGVKRARCVKDVLRNTQPNCSARFIELATGLHNLRVHHRKRRLRR